MQPETRARIETADWERDARILHSVREAVFVNEQHVPVELEWDGLDPQCTHVIAYVDDDTPVATGRLGADGHIGRLAVLKPWRGRGIGSQVLRALIAIARSNGLDACALNAQTHAIAFYERHGFVAEGDEFDDAGIAHRHMVLKKGFG
jgi:predicted GNAT family N-acyltransferase